MIDQHQHPVLKYTAWTLFNSSFGLVLSPLCYLESSLLARAALLSTGVVASISAVGMTARRGQYLWLGAPLMAGLSVVCLASISSLILPSTAIKTLSVSEWISLYGGLAIFSGILLFDTQRMITNAEKAQDARTLSSINESLDIYMDTINIFIRILALLSKDDAREKKRSAATSRRK
ncbi:unnamed protein product [Rotaria sp. Silwood1]|nr:unnamed protein product [Rotaria sp. Silwood1]